jgi:hypothetical protein
MQKGRSGIWLADQGWWLIVVEFQPSTWSRGSHLNVGCMWLWNVKGHLSFDVGHRVTEFQPFETEQQFGPIAQRLTEQARDKVAEYRELFRTVRQVSDYYMRNTPNGFWPCFNAAVAHMMSGRVEPASVLLSQCVTPEEISLPQISDLAGVQPALAPPTPCGNTGASSRARVKPATKRPVHAHLSNTLYITGHLGDPPWLIEARQVAKTVASMTGEQIRLRQFISERVQETRLLLKLPPLEHIDFRSDE